jgi:hypothetical protein
MRTMNLRMCLMFVLAQESVTLGAQNGIGECDRTCIDTVCLKLKTRQELPILFRISSHLAMGRVVKAATLADRDCMADVTLRISHRWKGPEVNQIIVRTGNGCDGPFPFVIGREYLVSVTGEGTPDKPGTLPCAFPPLDGPDAMQHAYLLDQWMRDGGASR